VVAAALRPCFLLWVGGSGSEGVGAATAFRFFPVALPCVFESEPVVAAAVRFYFFLLWVEGSGLYEFAVAVALRFLPLTLPCVSDSGAAIASKGVEKSGEV
jgi:hypothetical protein